ncbi:45412_t:CDS:2, partial [Gigaspora margarita]
STDETVYLTSKRSTPIQHFTVDKNRRAKTQTSKEIKDYVSKLSIQNSTNIIPQNSKRLYSQVVKEDMLIPDTATPTEHIEWATTVLEKRKGPDIPVDLQI